MSDDQARIVPAKLLPPSVSDPRQAAYVDLLDDTLKSFDIASFVMSDVMTVDARLLPYLARERSVHTLIEPDMKQDYIRKLIANAYDINSKKGYIEGIRLGLSLLDISVTWVQWFQEEPKALHDTHKVSIFFDKPLFENSVLGDMRHRNAVTRIIHAMQRWSQDITITFGVKNTVKHYVGAVASHGGRYTAGLSSNDEVLRPAIIFTGVAAAFSSTYQAGMENN